MEEIYIKRNRNRLMRANAPKGKMYCPDCDSYKDLSEFYKRKKSKYGVMCICSSCLKLSRSSPSEKSRRFFYHKQRNYGIDQSELGALHKKQNGVCAICGKTGDRVHKGTKTGLYVDHDHITGKVRGLLCGPCNQGIGFLGDDISRIENAIKYLAGAKQ